MYRGGADSDADERWVCKNIILFSSDFMTNNRRDFKHLNQAYLQYRKILLYCSRRKTKICRVSCCEHLNYWTEKIDAATIGNHNNTLHGREYPTTTQHTQNIKQKHLKWPSNVVKKMAIYNCDAATAQHQRQATIKSHKSKIIARAITTNV